MPLIFKLRENNIVSNRLDLEQSIINNLAVFFDALPPKFVYKISIVSSITTKDGSNIKGASHQVLVSTSKTGIKKYKTVYNKWAVLDISVKTDGGVVRKLERIVLAPIDITSYNPTLGDLETESNSINVLVQSGGLKLADYSLQNTTTAPPQNSTSAPATAPAVSGTGNATNNSGSDLTLGASATTLTAWYQAQGQSLPTVSARAKIYESLNLGPAGTYTGTREENIALLDALKKSNGLAPTSVVSTVNPTVKLLGSTQYYILNSNGSDFAQTLEWGGNAPFGYRPVSKAEYIIQLQKQIDTAKALNTQYSIHRFANGNDFRYTTDGIAYVGNQLLDDAGIAALQKQISDAQNSIGIYATNYNSGNFSKFKLDASTPSEQFYTAQYFASLPSKEQARLKSLYPASY